MTLGISLFIKTDIVNLKMNVMDDTTEKKLQELKKGTALKFENEIQEVGVIIKTFGFLALENKDNTIGFTSTQIRENIKKRNIEISNLDSILIELYKSGILAKNEESKSIYWKFWFRIDFCEFYH
jgi:hypothetical protein